MTYAYCKGMQCAGNERQIWKREAGDGQRRCPDCGMALVRALKLHETDAWRLKREACRHQFNKSDNGESFCDFCAISKENWNKGWNFWSRNRPVTKKRKHTLTTYA